MKSGALAAEHPVYRLGDIIIDPARNCIERGGEIVSLRNKTFRTLLYLVEHRERLVSKEELFREVWEGAAVTDGALVQCIREIRHALNDDAQQPRIVKTMPRVGYQFIGVLGPPVIPSRPEGSHRSSLRYLAAAVMLIAVVGVLLYGVFGRLGTTAVASPGTPPVVAVLPFTNLSGETSLDWLVHGLPDMLLTGLTRTSDLQVLSRTRLEQLQLGAMPAADAARRAQAALLVTGAFAVIDGTIRIDAQVVDAVTQNVIRAESLAVAQPDLLRDIDLLALRLTAAMGARPRQDQPLVRTAMTADIEAYRAYSLAVARAHAFDTESALRLLEEAIGRDPQFAMAHARIGYVYTLVRVNERPKAVPYLEKAFRMADRLSEKDRLLVQAWYALARERDAEAVAPLRAVVDRYPLETEASWRLGQLLNYLGRVEEAMAAYERGLAIDPGAANVWNAIGFGYAGLGRYDRAIAAHERYVAIDPNEANAHDSLGMTYAQSGRFADALASFDRALALRPDFHFAVVHKGDVFFQLGRMREAAEMYRRYLAIAPSNWDRAMAIHHLAMVHWQQGDLAAAQLMASREAEFGVDFGTELRLAIASRQRQRIDQLERRYFGDAMTPGKGGLISKRDPAYLRGMLALERGRTEDAIRYFREALGFPNTQWGVNSLEDALARAYLSLGKADLAIAEYQRLLAINPHEAPTHFGLAQAFESAGRLSEARASYARMVELWSAADPDLPSLSFARTRLRQTS